MSEQMTITEALAEIKLSLRKIEKKEVKIQENLTRYSHMKDPFEADGGSQVGLKKEQQSIDDLFQRMEKIRAAIAKANLDTPITVGNKTRSMYEWLVWKREIADKQFHLYQRVSTSLKQKVDTEAVRPQVFQDAEKKTMELAKLIQNVDYSEYLKKLEAHNEIKERLDGQLSLKNATVVISF